MAVLAVVVAVVVAVVLLLRVVVAVVVVVDCSWPAPNVHWTNSIQFPCSALRMRTRRWETCFQLLPRPPSFASGHREIRSH